MSCVACVLQGALDMACSVVPRSAVQRNFFHSMSYELLRWRLEWLGAGSHTCSDEEWVGDGAGFYSLLRDRGQHLSAVAVRANGGASCLAGLMCNSQDWCSVLVSVRWLSGLALA